MPNTPGSSELLDATSETGGRTFMRCSTRLKAFNRRPDVAGVAWRTITAIRRHRNHHVTTINASPSNQIAKRTTVSVLDMLAEVDVFENVRTGPDENGWLAASIANGSADWSGVWGGAHDPRRSPTSANTAHGTRNFAKAASQIQYRMCAPFRRKTQVNTAATIATSVDCHK